MRLQQAFFNSSQGPDKENFERNSTGNASWCGSHKEKLDSQFLQTMQVGGAPQREIGFPISTDDASWGGTTK